MAGLREILVAALGLLLALVLAGCAKAPPETRELDVLSALVSSLGISSMRLVLMSYPSKCAAAGPPRRVPAAMFANFVAANGTDAELLRIPPERIDATVMNWEDNLRFLQDPELARANTNRVLLLASRVGFSEDSRQALVCAEVRLRGGHRTYLVLLDWLGDRDWQVSGEFGAQDSERDPRRRIHS